MNRIGWTLAAVVLAWAPQARPEVAVSPGDRYQVILDRNAFSLKPPVTNSAASVVAPVVPLKVNVQLSGISVRNGKRYAWLVMPPTPGVSTNTQYWKVEEGGEQGDYGVTSVDPRARLVKLLVKSSGQTTVLNLGSNSPPMIGAPVVPTAGALPGTPGAVIPGQPVLNPGMPRAPGLPAGMPVPSAVPASGVQRVGSTSSSLPARSIGGVSTGLADGAAGVRTVPPTRLVRTAVPDTGPAIDPAQQYINMRRQEAAARAAGVDMPPIPPIPELGE